MPSHKSKKSSSARSSMEKSKDTDLKCLSEYVDDRVELIRQAFMCLKPKTIKNIAPEFLKGKSIEKLQEVCLDEVLGVSKKRLLSIINATTCPSDTESSDSDAPKVIEGHISLSEISSDDDMLEDLNTRKVKKTHKKRSIKKEKNTDNKKIKNGKAEASTSAEGKKQMSEKEMTVLELLELQARARAIRSQLALEPVTKIELDSEEESESGKEKSAAEKPLSEATKEKMDQMGSKKVEKSSKHSSKEPKVSDPKSKQAESSKQSSNEKTSSGAEDRQKTDKKKRSKSSRTRSRSKSPNARKEAEKQKSPILDLRAKIEQRRSQNQSKPDETSQESTGQSRRRVVLKRNFNSQITVTTDNSDHNTNNVRSPNKKNDPGQTLPDEKVKKEQESERESSPDVIAMHPSPETILLTSSDEEHDDSKKKKNDKKPSEKTKSKSETTKEKARTQTREKSPGTLSLEAEEFDYDDKMSEPELENTENIASELNVEAKEIVSENNDEKSEMDSDEEKDNWEDKIDESVGKDLTNLNEPASSEGISEKPDDELSIMNSQASYQEEKSQNSSTVDQETQVKQSSNEEENPSHVVDVDELPDKVNSSSSSGSSSSESDSDDENAKNEKENPESADDADVVTIDINESSDEGKLNEDDENNQTWGQRWLRSKKVTKVMTSTKLGNKIRSKVKEKKIEEKKAIEEKERLEKLEQEKLAEEERKKLEEEKKATEVPEEVLGSTKHFKDLKLLSMLKEEREQRAAKRTARKSKKK